MPNYNFEGFKKKKFELMYRYNGLLEIWNPAEHELYKNDAMWSEYLAQDIIDIENNCTGIYMFGPWYRSQGACVELLSAHRLGLDIYIEQRWLKFVPFVLDILFKSKWPCGTTKFNGETNGK